MKAKFEFYERVKIITKNPSLSKLNGAHGTIVGKSEYGDSQWYYGVSVDLDDEGWCFEEHELESLGEFAKESDYKTGESIKVSSDGKLKE
tara:strand:- start:42656 stop:42925 length:270 start_codon:yes stop_codon:yes gene_type:complete